MSQQNIKLKACMAEIEKVMEKHGAGGYVILADAEGGEYKFINPKWSALKSNGDIMETRRGWINHRAADTRRTENTIHLLQVIQAAAGSAFIFSDECIKVAQNHFEITGEPRPI